MNPLVILRETVNDTAKLNDLATTVWARLVAEYPEWEHYFGVLEGGDLEVAIPAPSGSKAGHLVISTNLGEDRWIRYSHPRMVYSVDDDDEMIRIIQCLLAEKALFAVTMKGEEWAGTTLLRPSDSPELEPGQMVKIVSWTGALDREECFQS